MITSFVRPDWFENMGGILSFQFAPIDTICKMYPISAGYTCADVLFKDDYTWLDGYSTRYKSKYAEPKELTPNGEIYKKNFPGVFPKNTPGTLALFNEMRKKFFILKVRDMNNQIRIVGDLDNPLQFTFDQDHGQANTDLNSFSFLFYGQSFDPSPYMVE